MARVPTAAPLQRIDPRPITPAYQPNSGLLADAVQTQGSSQNIERAAQKIEGAGDVLAQEAIKQANEDNERAAKEADVKLSERMRAIMFGDGSEQNPGYYGLKGQAALDAYGPTQEAIKKAREEVSRGLNPRAKLLFDPSADNRFNTEFNSMSRYNLQERRVANDTVSEIRIKEFNDSGIAAWNDPQRVAQSVAGIRGEVVGMGQRNGWSPEIVNSKIQEEQSKLYAGMINAALVHDPMAAQKLYDSYKTSIDGTARAAIEKALETGTVRAESQKETARIQGMGLSIQQQVAEAKKTIKDPKVQDDTVERLQKDWAFNERVKDEARRATVESAWAAVLKGGSVDNLPPQALATMGPAVASLLEFEKNRAARGNGYALASDPATKNELQNAFLNDKVAFAQMDLNQYRPKLTETEYNHWQAMQRTVDSRQEAEQNRAANYTLAGRMAEEYARAAGINPSKPGENAAKYGKIVDISRQVVDDAQAQGKKATREDIEKALNASFLQGEVQGVTGTFGQTTRKPLYQFSQTERANFEITKPEKQYDAIAKAAGVPAAKVPDAVGALRMAKMKITVDNVAKIAGVPLAYVPKIIEALRVGGKDITAENIAKTYGAAVNAR